LKLQWMVNGTEASWRNLWGDHLSYVPSSEAQRKIGLSSSPLRNKISEYTPNQS
jgi:hypothetical protein